MPRLDELPPDLRATLSLLVDRGKSYAQVAELLGIPEHAVRDRAHAALDALAGAPETGARPSAAAAQIAAARHAQEGAAAARSDTPHPARRDPTAPHTSASGPAPALPVSRRGGAALLAGIAVVVAIVVVLITSGGGGGSSHTNTNASAGTPAGTGTSANGKSGSGTGTTGATGTSKSGGSKAPTVTNQLTLTPPDPASKAIGIVEILAEGSQRAFYMAAEHLPPSTGFSYVIWLYNSPSSAEAISKAPSVGANGRMQGGALLPANAGDYHQILITRETGEHPTHPGPTALSGAFSLGG